MRTRLQTSWSDDSAEDILSGYTTRGQTDLATERTLRALAEMEARLARQMTQSVGILLGGMALTVGVILGFG